MTTDVINGVPRELRSVLSMILSALDRDAAEGKTVRGEMAEELRRILTTAQPAADGEREAAPGWAHWAAGDTVRYVSSGGFIHARMTVDSDYLIHEAPDDCESMLVLDDDGDELSVLVGEFEWQARAAQPQQAVAVTDEVRALLQRAKGVLEEVWEFSYEHGAASALSARDMAEEIDAALSAHKTGEEA